MISRRQFHASMLAGFGACLLPRAAQAAPADAATQAWVQKMQAGLAAIAASSGGRLGVAVQDTASGATATLRGDERFPMCSTFKVLAAAAVLKQVDQHKENLERRLTFKASQLVANSPVTKEHADSAGLSLAQLCEAAITVSDNTAANLILGTLGGPAGLTRYIRTLGDQTTRLDRNEPGLNQALPGDPRDTTTPLAMLGDLRSLLLGDALSPASRAQLLAWLKASKTSGQRLRARLPAGWVAGDKTGSGELGTTNDVGILFPPQRAPVLVAVYLTDTRAPAAQANATIAAVGALVADV